MLNSKQLRSRSKKSKGRQSKRGGTLQDYGESSGRGSPPKKTRRRSYEIKRKPARTLLIGRANWENGLRVPTQLKKGGGERLGSGELN